MMRILAAALAASVLAFSSVLPVRAQDVEPSRAELVRLRAEARAQIAQALCVEPAGEQRDVVRELLRRPRPVVRRALLRYLTEVHARLLACSLGTGPILEPTRRPRRAVASFRDIRTDPPGGDVSAFRRLLAGHMSPIRACYERSATDLGGATEITLSTAVAANGRLEESRVVAREGELPTDVEACVCQQTRRMTTTAGEPTSYVWVLRVHLEEVPDPPVDR